MKKIVSIILSLVSVICVAIAFVGCGNKTENESITVEGKFYTLKQAYENGWVNEEDLKSIACSYYDNSSMENPYSDYHKEQTEQLSNKKEKELKQAYLNQIDKLPDGDIEKVKIFKYYGTYNENIIVKIWSEYFICDIIVNEEYYIGDVVFKKFWENDILVYHI